MERESLAVFIHGIGANEGKWWGSTPHAFKSDSGLDHIQFQFYGYDTAKAPEKPWWMPHFFYKKKLANLEQIGEDLWAQLESYGGRDKRIALFGHSMGGLVMSAALAHGFRENASEAEKRLRNQIKVVGLCATPFGGARLATLVKQFTALYGGNAHVEALCEDSDLRKRIVAKVLNCVTIDRTDSSGRVPVDFFVVASDTTVGSDDERFGEFLKDMDRTSRIPLRGGHSDCVQNLNAQHDNYKRIAKWLRDHLSPPTETAASLSIPKANETGPFDDRLTELEEEIAVDGAFSRWRESADREQPTSSYMLRIFLQKLLHAATTMHPNAKSANAWVCHRMADNKPCALRSAEREGFFSVSQLIQKGGNVGHRWNTISWSRDDEKQLSAAALAVVLRHAVLTIPKESEYPSPKEEIAKVSHILGVPLHDVRDDSQSSLEGVPLSMTIDFKFDFTDEPPKELKEHLEKQGQKLNDLFVRFRKCWKGKLTLPTD